MARPAGSPRLETVPIQALDDDLRDRITAAISTTAGATNLYLTLARHPGLARRYLPFAGKLLPAGKLPVRARELAILRTAWRCGSDYEWGQHERIAQDCGISWNEIQCVVMPSPSDVFDQPDRCVLVACDELVAQHRVSAGTWEDLVGYYEDIGTIELIMLVGNYVMLAGLLNSVGVAREPGVPGLPSPSAADDCEGMR